MKKTFNNVLMLLGRILISLIFFVTAYWKITHWELALGEMAFRHIPQPSIILFAACIIEFFGAISLVLGYKARLAGLVMGLFLIPVTYLFHDFWAFSGEQWTTELLMFLKNAGLIGGLFYIAANGAGSYALETK